MAERPTREPSSAREELDDTRLLGREQLAPDRGEVGEQNRDFALGDLVGLALRGRPASRDHLRCGQEFLDVVQHRALELIDRARAVAQVFRLAREERDAWVNWPARVAAMIAAELEVDPHQLHSVLERHVWDHLAELAEIRPNLR
jgi:hypothetical protein